MVSVLRISKSSLAHVDDYSWGIARVTFGGDALKQCFFDQLNGGMPDASETTCPLSPSFGLPKGRIVHLRRKILSSTLSMTAGFPHGKEPNHMPTYHVHKFDYTNWSTDRRAAFKYKVFTDNDAMNAWDAVYMVYSLGAYDTLETAVFAIEADAGELGVTRCESTYDEVDEHDVVVAAFNLGSNGLLAARGTREEYAEWAYETVHEEGARDFAEQAQRAVRAAVEEEMSIPDVDTLIDMMEAYLAQGPNEDDRDE